MKRPSELAKMYLTVAALTAALTVLMGTIGAFDRDKLMAGLRCVSHHMDECPPTWHVDYVMDRPGHVILTNPKAETNR